MKRFTTSRVALVALVAVACGGGGDSGPGPLKHHFDEKMIAKVEMSERTALEQAQTAYNRAKSEKMKAEADHDDVKTQLDLAKNEREQAKISKESAGKKKSAANDSGDMTRVNAAMRDDRVAELGVRAADQKVDMLNAKKSWLKKLIRYTEENTYAAEAKVELAEARLAKAHNIAPRGFAFQAFVDQQEARSRDAQRAKLIADREHEKWLSEQKEWVAKKAESDHARGVDTASKGGK